MPEEYALTVFEDALNLDAESTSTPEASPKPLQNIAFTPILFSTIMACYVLLPPGHPARWTIYVTPLVLTLELTSRGRLRANLTTILLIISYIVYSTIPAFFHVDFGYYWKDTVFITLSMSVFMFTYKTGETAIYAIISASILSVLLLYLKTDAPLLAVSLGQSRAAAESSLGLALPLVALLLHVQKKHVLMWLTIGICFLMYKRIAILSLLLVVGLDFFLVSIVRCKESIQYTISCAALAILSLIGLNFGAVIRWIADWLSFFMDFHLSVNQFSAGRYFVDQVFRSDVLDKNSLFNWMFGNGAGSSTAYLDKIGYLTNFNFPLLHNDWLRILSEYGFLGLFSIILLFTLMMRKGRLYRLIIVYTAFCFLTDNVATYLFYWIIFSFVARNENWPLMTNKFHEHSHPA